MSELKTLSVQKRSAFGKGANRRLRVKALVPGVFYASDGTNVPVQMPALPEGVKVVFKNDFTVVAVLSEQQEAAEAAE